MVETNWPMNSETSGKNFNPKMIFALAVAVAVVIRLYLLWQYYCISSDGIHYIEAARKFYLGTLPRDWGITILRRTQV